TPANPLPLSVFNDGGSLSWLGIVLKVILGIPGDITSQNLALHLAVAMILVFALFEILSTFSFFSPAASWPIAIGLTIVSGAVGATESMTSIFGAAAKLGSIGILIVILTAIFSVVSMHIGLGKQIRRWRFERQAEISAYRSEEGVDATKAAIKGLKSVNKAFTDKGNLRK
ncbi:hypothetical protein COV22_04310, partial [Candidatus Woesearchaeota archaeon CG10_big_fil_rev_8_21_14_0_10_47_5]